MSTYLHNLLLCTFLLPIACTGEDKNEEGQIEDTTGTPSETDLDGDGISNEDDLDADGDGIPVTEDCDDANAELLSTSEDLDCDGTVVAEDTDHGPPLPLVQWREEDFLVDIRENWS